MTDKDTAHAEIHDKMVRALKHLRGSPQALTRPEIVAIVREQFPELTKSEIRPQKHCQNYASAPACACSQTDRALFEKVEGAGGAFCYRVRRPQVSAPPPAELPPLPALPPVAVAPALSPRRRLWHTLKRGLQQVVTVPETRPADEVLRELPTFTPPPVPALEVTQLPSPDGLQRLVLHNPQLRPEQRQRLRLEPTAHACRLSVVHVLSAGEAVRDLELVGPAPLELGFRLYGEPGLNSRLYLYALTDHEWQLVHKTKQSFVLEAEPSPLPALPPLVTPLPLEPLSAERLFEAWEAEDPFAGLELIADAPEPEIPVVEMPLIETAGLPEPAVPSEPVLEARLADIPDLSEPEVSAELPEPVPEIPLLEASPPETPAPPEPEAHQAPLQPILAETVAKTPVADVSPPPVPADPLAWLQDLPETYHPLLLHLQTHGSLNETAMVKLLGGGSKGARKARAFAAQVETWPLPFELEITHTPEGKTYRKV